MGVGEGEINVSCNLYCFYILAKCNRHDEFKCNALFWSCFQCAWTVTSLVMSYTDFVILVVEMCTVCTESGDL